MESWDAIVVGAGPNGLAAGIELARAGREVLVVEAEPRIGGACRSLALTLPGFIHDVGAAILPLAYASPFFHTLRLTDHGVCWVYPPAAVAHPLDDGDAIVLWPDVARTAVELGPDAASYRRLVGPLVARWDALTPELLGPLRLPRHPLALARFALPGLLPATALARGLFRGERARALFAGLAAHSFLPLEHSPSAAFGLVLAVLGHVTGWPFPEGGAQRLADALAAGLTALGGRIVTGRRVASMTALPAARAVLFDVTPRQLAALARDRLPAGYLARLHRYRYGPGVFKVDYALAAPIPWRAGACAQAGTVHLGGTLEEIAASERAVWEGKAPERPFVLLAQHTLFDPTRAPAGRHTAWAYCHVPNGCREDMTARLEAQIERFAPGFRERVLARHAMGPLELERLDANLIGGDINGGVQDLRQLYARPTPRTVPYATPTPNIYICSSSTPPGGGVHGMCGYHAARVALRRGV